MQNILCLLKEIPFFSRLPEKELSSIAQHLEMGRHPAGSVLVEEETPGENLYLICSGQVSIQKSVLKGKAQVDLALLGPGEFFGEMALLEEKTRSARATAQTPVTVLKLSRNGLLAWMKSNPCQVLWFVFHLIRTMSGRLRRTSHELILLFELSHLLLQPYSPQNLHQVLERFLESLEGAWSAKLCLWNALTEEMDPVQHMGNRPPDFQTRWQNAWQSPGTGFWEESPSGPILVCWLKKETSLFGCLLLQSHAPIQTSLREEITRLTITLAHLLSSLLESRNLREEEALKERLRLAKF